MISMDDLIAAASVGTSRKPPALGGGDGPLGEALSTVDKALSASAESKLLGAVAVLSRYEACGRLPTPDAAAPQAAAEETQPPCSRRAADLLGQILAMSNTQDKDRLVAQWLDHALTASQRAPWRILPALLDYGVGRRAGREAIARVSGARGSWLMAQNPRWQYAAGQQDDPRQLWSTGTRDQRLSAATRLRQSDPRAALELIQSTWKEDSADERAAFVAALATSLSPDDEPFLEAALDDRSKQVRAAAAELLQRLPTSALLTRMIERVTPLLTLAVDRAHKRIDVTLPPDTFDPSWERDGIVEKPDTRTGRRQWWLTQMVSAVPPAHWSQTWKLSPRECVAALAGELADVVLEAWQQAAQRHPDPDWVSALLHAAIKDGRGPLTLQLLAHLPVDAREQVTVEILDAPKSDLQQVAALLHVSGEALGKQASAALVRRIGQSVERRTQNGYDYLTAQVLQEAACRVSPDLHDELAGRWTGEKWEQVRKARDEFLQTLQLRRDLAGEFQGTKH